MPPHVGDPHDHLVPSGPTAPTGTDATFSTDSSFSLVITESNAAQTVTGKINVIDPDAGQACLDLARTLGYSTASDYYKTGEATRTGSYYGSKTIFTLLSNNQLAVISDGDPYPAKAGAINFTNDLISTRFTSFIIEQDFEYKFTYRGGNLNSDASYSNFFSTSAMGIQGIFLNGVALYNPSSGNGTVPGTTISGNNTHNLNAVFFEQQYGIDAAGGHPSPEGNMVNGFQGQSHYHDPMFLTSGSWNNETFASSNAYFANDYYTDASANIDYIRHADGHSKIVGFCFDGYPIYGPYGYDASFNPTSPSVLMTTSYRTREIEFPGRPYAYDASLSGYTLSAGAFLDDYEYVPGMGSLDDCNGRFCVTPEYPNGTYAYFVLINEEDEPVFPYILGKYSRQQRNVINGGYPADTHETGGSVIPTTGAAGVFDVSTLGVSKYVSSPINQTVVDASYGSFTIDSSGNWSYTMDGPHDEFVTDVSYNDSIRVYSYDGSANRLVTVTMMGTAEAPAGPTPSPLEGNNNVDTQGVTYSLLAGQATVSGYSGSDGASIVIPAQVSKDGATYNVVKINDFVFYNKNISSVTFNGNNLTFIGRSAFENCRISALTIPDSVTSIDENVFSSCLELTAATIGNAVTSIPWGLFGGCSKLTAVALGNAVATITDYAINYSQLSSLTVGSGNTTFFNGPNNELYQIIDSNSVSIVFVPSTATSFTIPSTYNGYSVTTIGTNAFSNRILLTSVTVPASVTNIPGGAFNGCTLLTNIAVDPANTIYAVQDGIIYQKVDSVNATVSMAFGTVTNVTIPATISIGGAAIPVTSIPDSLFSGRTSLTAVSIGNNVSYIGPAAFANTRIESVNIPASVTTMEFWAFADVTSLTSVTFAENSQLTTLRSAVFSNTQISTINIPNGMLTIEDSVFNACSLLTNVIIPSSVTSIDGNAFNGCVLLTDLAIDSANATYIEQDGIIYQQVDAANAKVAFALSTVTNINIPASVSSGGLSIPVTSIANNAFVNNFVLTSVTIPDAVTSIGFYAFGYCSQLTSVTIGANVTTIGGIAFIQCTQLSSVTIPASVTYIGSRAFYCDNLANVYFLGDNVTTAYGDSQQQCDFFTYGQFADFDTNPPSSRIAANAVAHYVDGTAGWSTYSSANPPEGFSNIQTFVPEGSGSGGNTDTIDANNADAQGVIYTLLAGEAAVSGYSGTGGAIVIPAQVSKSGTSYTVTSIVYAAFQSSSVLTAVTIGASVTSISDAAFRYCSELTAVTIGSNVQSIGSSVFKGCSKLTAVTIPDAVTSIGTQAFYECSQLTSATIGANVTSIGDDTFRSCSQLISVTIGANVTSIGSTAFMSCSQLTSVNIPDAVTSIGNNAFQGCENVESIHLGANVAYIGNQAFDSCRNVSTVTIPASVTHIGSYAFIWGGNMQSVYFLGDNTDNRYFVNNTSFEFRKGTEWVSHYSGAPWFTPAMSNDGCPPATAYYIAGKDGWDTYNSQNLPVEFAAITTFVPEGSGSGGNTDTIDANNADAQGVTYTLLAGEATVSSYSGSATSVSIPAQVTKSGTAYTVTNMDISFFQSFNGTSLSLPSTISYIHPYNIGRVSNLTSLSVNSANPYFMVQDGLLYNLHTESGNNYATVWGGFNDPTISNPVTVNSVTKGDVTYPVTSIHEDQAPLMFWGATSVIFGDNVTSVGGGDAFHSNTHIVSILIMNSGVPVNFHDIGSQFTTLTIGSAPDHSSGSLTVADGDQIGAVTGGTVIVSGGTASVNSTAGNFTLTLDSGNAIVTTLNGSWSASVSLESGKRLETSEGTFAGTLSGAGTLEKTGAGTLILSGASAMNFSGKVAIAEGIVETTTTESLGATSTVELGSTGSTANPVLKFNISGSSTNAITNKISALSSGSNTVQNAGTTAVSLVGGLEKDGTALQLNGEFVVNSNITGSSANSDLVLGNGSTSTADVTLVSGNTYDYNGPTTVNLGSTLTLQDGVALPNSDVTISGGATLVLEYTTSAITANSVNSLTLNNVSSAQHTSGYDNGRVIVNISSDLAAGDYTVLSANTNIDVKLGVIQIDPQVNYTGSNGFSATVNMNDNNYVVTITDNSAPEPEPEPTPSSNVCFPAKTPVLTNQGPVNIEDINPAVHTIRNKKIVAITKTVAHDKNLVRIAKHALGKNYPEKTTLISQNHKVLCQGQMIKAKHLVGENENVTFVPYNGQVLYNVLLEEHEKMQVNNLIVETLHPEHKVAKLYRFLKNVDAAHHGKFIAAFNKCDREQRLRR